MEEADESAWILPLGQLGVDSGIATYGTSFARGERLPQSHHVALQPKLLL